jgi:hypothetical protein
MVCLVRVASSWAERYHRHREARLDSLDYYLGVMSRAENWQTRIGDAT